MAPVPTAARRAPSASVSATFFHQLCRQSAYDATQVYWDSHAQDRSTSVEAQRAAPIVVQDARR